MSEAVTNIISSLDAPILPNGVIAYEDLKGEGDAPGTVAYVHYNGPTDQLATMCTGMAVLDPGASPHKPHQHPEEELLIISSGTGVIDVAGKLSEVGPGAIMYVGSMVSHGIVNTGAVPMTFFWAKWIAKGYE
jgi:mannose-6-phosphate isomerase-like protein (cupin superfamily)